MKLYLISQEHVGGYDTYDSAVVSAKDEQDAKSIHPSDYTTHVTNGKWMGTYSGGDEIGKEYESGSYSGWVDYSDIGKIKVKLIGDSSVPRGLILASFNAG